MTNFQVGDKVVYMGNNVGKVFSRSRLGDKGVVLDVDEEVCVVQWSDNKSKHLAINLMITYDFEIEL